jgi:hypothetical protein
MHIVDWTICKHKVAIAAFLPYFIVSGIHPAAVKCPVSAYLADRSSHVKLSVRSIARSILCCWSLIQRNLTVISGPLNVGKHSKDSRKLLISYCEIMSNEILRKVNSEARILNVLSCVEAIDVSVLNVSVLSTGKKLCD